MTTAQSVGSCAWHAAPGSLKPVLPTTASPLPLNVYGHHEFGCSIWLWEDPFRVAVLTTEAAALNELHPQQRFKELCEMYAAWAFQSVLCADVHDCVAEHGIQKPKRIAKQEKAEGGSGYLPREPLIVSETQLPRTRLGDPHVGYTGQYGIASNALKSVMRIRTEKAR